MKSITIDGWVYPLRVTPSKNDDYLCDVVFQYDDDDQFEFAVSTNSADELVYHLEFERADELPKLRRYLAPGNLRLVV